MKRWLGFVLLTAFTAGAGAVPKNKLKPSAEKALSNPHEIIFYSLEPEGETDASQAQIHHFKILGEARLNEKQTARATKEFKAAIAGWDGFVAACFNPRQALRTAYSGHIYDFLLCYECHQLYVYEDDQLLQGLGATGSPEVLNALLTELHIPLAHTESPEELEAQRTKRAEEDRRWEEAMPKSLRRFWPKMRDEITPTPEVKKFRAPLAREYPEVRQRILALFKWYGSGAGPWSGFPTYEEAPELLLLEFSMNELVDAAQQNQLSDVQLEGAARFFAGWDLSKAHAKDLKLLPPDLKKKLLDHSLKSHDTDNQERAKAAFED